MKLLMKWICVFQANYIPSISIPGAVMTDVIRGYDGQIERLLQSAGLWREAFYSLNMAWSVIQYTVCYRNYTQGFVVLWFVVVNTLKQRQNCRHFADDTFKRIFLNQNVRNSISISLKFVPKGLIHNITSLVQIMVWRQPGDKPLSEPMMVRLLTHQSSVLRTLMWSIYMYLPEMFHCTQQWQDCQWVSAR